MLKDVGKTRYYLKDAEVIEDAGFLGSDAASRGVLRCLENKLPSITALDLRSTESLCEEFTLIVLRWLQFLCRTKYWAVSISTPAFNIQTTRSNITHLFTLPTQRIHVLYISHNKHRLLS